jgi:hypothetical protein
VTQYLPLPDGSYLKLREGETTEAGLLRAQKTYPEAFNAPKSVKNTSQDYANWLRANEGKRGSPDYETVLRAFQEAKLEELQQAPKSKVQDGSISSNDSLSSHKPPPSVPDISGAATNVYQLSSKNDSRSLGSTDLPKALTAAGVGFIIAFALMFFIYRRFKNKYAYRPHRYFFIIALFSIGFGIGSVVNEVVHSLLMGFEIRVDELLKPTVSTIFVVLVMLIVKKIFPASGPQKIIDGSSLASKAVLDLAGDSMKSGEQDLEHWKIALDEFESENRQRSLWANLYAKYNGDESRAKAEYLKVRAEFFSNNPRG